MVGKKLLCFLWLYYITNRTRCPHSQTTGEGERIVIERHNLNIKTEKRNVYGKAGVIYLYFACYRRSCKHGRRRSPTLDYTEELVEVSKLGIDEGSVEMRKQQLLEKLTGKKTL